MKQSSTRRQRAWTRRPTMTLAEIATVARVKARLKGQPITFFVPPGAVAQLPPGASVRYIDDFLDALTYGLTKLPRGIANVQRLV